ncbi:hypothetical protein CDL15_Pgr021056 [Punica granatum]|uniref:Uncharacterized protein n=1 Tax=Punica granatum TaxID=22663 RepID=A0A218WDT2_PUNGR|nr:hypothetical protein CDL15_Pgr021056 [Punica granatum]
MQSRGVFKKYTGHKINPAARKKTQSEKKREKPANEEREKRRGKNPSMNKTRYRRDIKLRHRQFKEDSTNPDKKGSSKRKLLDGNRTQRTRRSNYSNPSPLQTREKKESSLLGRKPLGAI